MITSNTRFTDPDDAGLLFHSILRYAQENAERLDQSILSIGYANLLQNAFSAAAALAEQHTDTGPMWDGCVWLERLEDIGPGSLAQSLYAERPDVASIVATWLAARA